MLQLDLRQSAFLEQELGDMNFKFHIVYLLCGDLWCIWGPCGCSILLLLRFMARQPVQKHVVGKNTCFVVYSGAVL